MISKIVCIFGSDYEFTHIGNPEKGQYSCETILSCNFLDQG